MSLADVPGGEVVDTAAQDAADTAQAAADSALHAVDEAAHQAELAAAHADHAAGDGAEGADAAVHQAIGRLEGKLDSLAAAVAGLAAVKSEPAHDEPAADEDAAGVEQLVVNEKRSAPEGSGSESRRRRVGYKRSRK